MKRSTRMVNWVLRGIFRTICRIDLPELKKVPLHGPLILVGNHVNFLESPVIIPHLDPREVVGLAKRESWDNPLLSFLFNQWEVIPIDRGTVDRDAFRQSIDVLAMGKMLAVFPEGTRSKDGCLLQGKPGIVALAMRSKAPLLPMAFYGYEDFWPRLKSFRRTDFHIKVGKPFRLDCGGEALSREVRQAATDEILYKIAELLPERYHGYYKGVENVQYRYIKELKT